MEKGYKSENAILRQKAEKILKKKTTQSEVQLSESEMLKLIHELHVHQIELELQNEELKIAKEFADVVFTKYIELYDSAPIGYFSLSPKGEILELNPAGAKMLGNDRENLKNSRFLLYVSNTSKPIFNLFLEKVFAGNIVQTCQLILSSSTILPIYINLNGIISGNGMHCFVTANDITESKRMEEDMRESEDLQSSLLKNIAVGIMIIDPETQIIERVNTFALRLIDESQANIIGRKCHYFLCPAPEQSGLVGDKGVEIDNTESVLLRNNKPPLPILKTVKKIRIGGKEKLLESFVDISVQKETEEALQQSTSKLEAILSASPDGIGISSLDGKVIYVSDKLAAMYGFSGEQKNEVIGQSILKFTDPSNHEKMKENIGKLLASGCASNITEYLTVRKDNSRLYADVNSTILFDSKGEPERILFIQRDVTERKNIEEVLKESERLLRESQEVAGLGSYVWNLTTGLWTSSNILDRIFGIDESYVRSFEGWLAIAHPDFREFMQNYITNEVLGKQQKFDKEYQVINQENGQECWVHGLGQLEFDNNRQPIKMIGTIQDITERKLTEETINNSKSKLSLALKIAHLGAWEYDVATDMFTFNDSFYAVFRTNSDQVGGNTMSSVDYANRFVHPEELAIVGNEIRMSIETANPDYCQQFEHMIIYADGGIGYMAVRFAIVKDENGKTIKLFGINQDITERKKTENEILTNSKRLKALVEILQYPSHSIQDYLDLALNKAIEMTDSKIGFIFLYCEEKKEFVLNSWSKDVMNECAIAEKQTVWKLENTGFWGEAVRQCKPIIVNDYQLPNPLKKGCPEGHAPLNRFLTIPMFENDKIVGVVAVANKKNNYTDNDTIQLTILMDIVWKALEKKKSDDELFESKERYRIIMDSVTLGISLIDVNHKIIMTNHFFAELFKKPAVDFVGRYCYNEFEKREAICPHCPAVLAMASGKPAEVETIGVRDDGSRFIVLLRTVPTFALDGTVSGFIEVIEDITKRKHAEESRHESEEKLSTLFASMTEMVTTHKLVFNENGDVVNYQINDCNEAFSTITGIKKEDAIGKLVTEVFRTDIPPHLDEFTRVATTGEPYEYTEYSNDIDKYLMVSVISPAKNQFSTIATDITVIQQIQDKIKDKNKELENYLYVASHDLRSPLVNIQGFSQRFLKQSDAIKNVLDKCQVDTETKNGLEKITTEDIPKTLNFILTNVAKMENLINGLLQISRTGRVVMTINKVDMNRLIKTIITSQNFQIMELSAKVIIEDLFDCYGDENLLNQLFSNIVNNALKYRDPGRQLVIEIACQVHFNKLIYSIKDSGIGMEPRHLEKIWDVFYRVDSGSDVTGEGIGLSLSRRITDKHKGKIWVESEVGKGSVFYVELQRNEFSE